MTALENVALPLEFAGKADAFDAARAMLDEVGLSHRDGSFSGPALGRRAAARGACPRAQPPARRSCLPTSRPAISTARPASHVVDLLFNLQRRRQATLILVTHDVSLAERCGRVVRMADGRIERGARAGMTVAALDRRAGPSRRGLPLVLSLALREQRNGFSGFYVFIACVALGVAAITGVGALADALRASFERQGEVLLGGDVTLVAPAPGRRGRRARLAAEAGPRERDGDRARHGAAAGRHRAGAGRAEGRRCRLSAGRRREAFRRHAARRCDPARARRRRRSASCSSGSSLKVGDTHLARHDAGADPRHHRGRARQDHRAAHRRPARARLAGDACSARA